MKTQWIFKSVSMRNKHLEEQAVEESYRWTNSLLVKLIKIIRKWIFTFSFFLRITWLRKTSGKILWRFLKKSFLNYLSEILNCLVVLDKMFILWLFFNLKLKRIKAVTKNKAKKEEEKDLLGSSFYFFTANFIW